MMVTFADIINKRHYGIVCLPGGGKTYRNYKRVLKNGRGLTYFEAVYAAYDFGNYIPLFNESTPNPHQDKQP